MKTNQNPNPKSSTSKVETSYPFIRGGDLEAARKLCEECTLAPGLVMENQVQHVTLSCMLCFSRLNGWSDPNPCPNPFIIPPR